MTQTLERRLRQLRSRVLVRSWEYRQRRHANGVWLRLRRVPAGAREVYAAAPETADELAQEGYRPEPVGQEFDPPRRIVFVPAARAARIPSARRLAVRLNAELLAAECLVLVAFETT
jgi:hypothetical protein